jgi:hypothetical protein
MISTVRTRRQTAQAALDRLLQIEENDSGEDESSLDESEEVRVSSILL